MPLGKRPLASRSVGELDRAILASAKNTAKACDLPTVPRPPTLMWPNLQNGALNMVMFGVTFRITVTFAGSCGTSLELIFGGIAGNESSLNVES